MFKFVIPLLVLVFSSAVSLRGASALSLTLAAAVDSKSWVTLGDAQPAEQDISRNGEVSLKLKWRKNVDPEWGARWETTLSPPPDGCNRLQVEWRSKGNDLGRIEFAAGGEGGWKRFLPAAASKSWEVLDLYIEEVSDKGTLEWNAANKLRLSIFSFSGEEDSLEIKSIQWACGYTAESIGQIGGFKRFPEAREAIWKKVVDSYIEDEVQPLLDIAGVFYRAAQAAQDINSSSMQTMIADGRQNMIRALAASQAAPKDQMRAAWLSHARGIDDQNGKRVQRWPQTFTEIKAAGLTAVFVPAAWAGAAFYPSQVLKQHGSVADEKDGFLQALTMAAKSGLDIYAVVHLWDLADGWLAPFGTADEFAAQNRLQLNPQGEELTWLCPCDPRNRELMQNAIAEMAQLNPKGIHLQSHLFSGQEFSYSQACRTAFEEERGTALENWPQEILADPTKIQEYQDFQRGLLSQFLEELRSRLKADNSSVQLSASVLASPSTARNSALQDWTLWLEKEMVDFVVTIANSSSPAGMQAMLTNQKKQLKKKYWDRVYPGLEWSLDSVKNVRLETALSQWVEVAEAKQAGFVWMAWGSQSFDDLAQHLAGGSFGVGYPPKKPMPDWNRAPLSITPVGLKLGDFESGQLPTAWSVHADGHGLGSDASASAVVNLPRKESQFVLKLEGKMGDARAPWPYVYAAYQLTPSAQALSLAQMATLDFLVKGQGKWEVQLVDLSVADGKYPGAVFEAGKKWTAISLKASDFVGNRSAVTQIRFRPVAKDSLDFHLLLDDVWLRP